MSSLVAKPTKWHVRPAKIQISLGIRPVWSESSLSAMKKAWVLSYPMSAQRRLWSDWADAQVDLSLRWAHMPFCCFCHEAAQMVFEPIGLKLAWFMNYLPLAKIMSSSLQNILTKLRKWVNFHSLNLWIILKLHRQYSTRIRVIQISELVKYLSLLMDIDLQKGKQNSTTTHTSSSSSVNIPPPTFLYNSTTPTMEYRTLKTTCRSTWNPSPPSSNRSLAEIAR